MYQCHHHPRGAAHCGDCLAAWHDEQARVAALHKTPITQGGRLAASLAEVADVLPDYYFDPRGTEVVEGLTEIAGQVYAILRHLPYGERPASYTSAAISYSIA